MIYPSRRAFVALGLAALIGGAAPLAHAADERPANIARIVSIGGSVTEIIFALGAESHVVAVDSTSRFPANATKLPNVGYMRRLSAEPIAALDPSLVIAIHDSGPPEALDQLRAAGLDVRVIEDKPTPEGVARKIEAIAHAIGRDAEGAALVAKLRAEFAGLERKLASIGERPRVIFLLTIGQGTPLAGGTNTAADGMIALAGGHNAFGDFEGYKPLSLEAAVSAAPEVLLVTDQTLASLGGMEAFLARPEVATTPAGRARRVVTMDGLLLLGFGPRTPEAVRNLAEALHPTLRLSSSRAERGSRR